MFEQKKTEDIKKLGEPGLIKPAIGLESEFTVYVDGQERKPEKVFGDPKVFLAQDSMHRVGSSYHIPTGGAVYFDSGVIEIATPVIEIEKGCAARAGRSLWEGIHFLRDELDKWEARNGKSIRLGGFSSHYNVSFDLPEEQRGDNRTEKKLALLLSYILPVPVMLLVANRKSTGIGFRPRGDRIEITSDFVPSPSLMVAAATLITAVVREVMTWPSYELGMLEKMNIPVIEGYKPTKHTSRKGWLAKDNCFRTNPFTCDIDEKIWDTTGSEKKQSLRAIANTVYQEFAPAVAEVSGPFTAKMIPSVFAGKAHSLLDLPDRPKEYDDVGNLCGWNNLYSEKDLARSKYERVLICSILRRTLVVGGNEYKPVGMKGWEEVVFQRKSDQKRKAFHIDTLTGFLNDWEKNS